MFASCKLWIRNYQCRNKVKVVGLAEEFVKLSFYQLWITREVVLVRGVTAFSGDLT